MEGISQELLRQHFDLYKGYVNNANALLKDITSGAVTGASLTDRRRRLGFELDGVYMHELFFENIRQLVNLVSLQILMQKHLAKPLDILPV